MCEMGSGEVSLSQEDREQDFLCICVFCAAVYCGCVALEKV